MRLSKPVIILGIILIVLGTVFLSQGRGQIGPESSFMYQNNDWIYYGMGMIIAGIVVGGFGIFLLRL